MHQNGKVLFIVHDVYQEDNAFPLGPAYLSAVLRENQTEVVICCQDVYHYSNEELAEKYLIGKTYDLIGIGFLSARFEETIVELCKIVNQHKGKAKLILGGHGPSAIPDYTMDRTGADLIALGEAEQTIVRVVNIIVKGGDLFAIPGLVIRKGKRAIKTQGKRLVQNIDQLPFPAWDLFPMEIYTTNMQYAGQRKNEKSFEILTSRGCVNQCSFCHRLEKGIRSRSMENVIEEMSLLHDRYGITYFVIQDELFLSSVKRLRKFIESLDTCGLLGNVRYNISGGIRASLITDELAFLLKKSGCCYVNIGFESVHQEILDELDKNTHVEDNYRAADILSSYGIPMGLNFIWGLRGDTERTLKDSVDFIRKYNDYTELATIRPVTPFPGSPLYDDAIEKGLLSGPQDFFSQFKNSDLITVNFTQFSNRKAHELLFQANMQLISDYYAKISGSMTEAAGIINDYFNLYFREASEFRGVRHHTRQVG